MSDNTINTTVEILGKSYQIRCKEANMDALTKAATFLDTQMKEIRDAGKIINVERIAVISALNIASQFLQLNEKNENIVGKINERIHRLHEKISTVMPEPTQTDLFCSNDQ